MNNTQQVVINAVCGFKMAYQYKQLGDLKEKVHNLKINATEKSKYINRILQIDYKVSNYYINNKIIQELNRELNMLKDFVNE